MRRKWCNYTDMDREIPKTELRRRARRRIIIIIAVAAVVAAVIVGVALLTGTTVSSRDLTIKRADRGTIENSVTASGKVVPLREQAIVSPVATRILEVYRQEGDTVAVGESLLRLDLTDAETEVRHMADEVSMKQNEMERTALSGRTSVSELEMRIRAKEMSVAHLKANVANERRLDSIGSGTGDRIREAQLAYETGRLELEQLRMQLANERKSQEAAYRSKQLEGSITARNLEAAQRTLSDARITAPHAGTITYINRNLGTAIGAGERLAAIADLTHFRIKAEIPESNSSRLTVGANVRVKVNRHTLSGRIAGISPSSQGGMVEFSVMLDNDNAPGLRPGLNAELNIVFDILGDAVRIPNGSYYSSPGKYIMFVKTGENTLERREVTLGGGNFDYVEVKSGLRPGEEVVLTDMSIYKNKRKLNIRN